MKECTCEVDNIKWNKFTLWTISGIWNTIYYKLSFIVKDLIVYDKKSKSLYSE